MRVLGAELPARGFGNFISKIMHLDIFAKILPKNIRTCLFFWKIYFVNLVVVKIIRRFEFGPIYTNLTVTIVVA